MNKQILAFVRQGNDMATTIKTFGISRRTYCRYKSFKGEIKNESGKNHGIKIQLDREKYEAIFDFIKGGGSYKEARDKFGISESTYYKYRNSDKTLETETKKKFVYNDGVYTINSVDQYGNKKQYNFDISFIDEVFFNFSINGANMTSQQVINWMREYHNMGQREFDIIKNALGLQKYSDAVSPVSLSLHDTKDNLDKLALDIASKSNEHKYFMSFKKAHPKSLQTIMQKWGKILASYSDLFDFYKEYLDGWIPNQYTMKNTRTQYTDSLFVGIADMHIGRETGVVVERLSRICSDLIEKNESDIIIFDLGDELETIIPDGMHTGQILEMDLLGIEQLSVGVKITASFIAELAKHKNVVYNIVTKSNHMRVDKEHNRDPQRIAGYIFAYLLQKEAEILNMNGYNVTVNIINDKVGLYQHGDYNFILSHGDDGFNKKRTLDILWNNKPSTGYNIVLSGDWHTAYIEQGKNYTRARIPSLNNPGQYAKDNSLCHQPGYITMKGVDSNLSTSFISLN